MIFLLRAAVICGLVAAVWQGDANTALFSQSKLADLRRQLEAEHPADRLGSLIETGLDRLARRSRAQNGTDPAGE
jgi:hypothetical protein